MLLRDSQFIGNGSYENIYGRIVGLSSAKTDPYKAEFLSLVEMLME